MQLLQNGKQQWIDQNGLPLANGTIGFYAVGTLNPLPTYQDQAGTVQNANPITLDSRGQAIVWGTGTYRQIVKDASSVIIWDQVVQSPDAGFLAFQANLADPTNIANGDALVAVEQPFAGASSTTQHEINAQRFSVFNAMTASQIADVSSGTGSIDVTAAINIAISASTVLGKRLFIPAGLYKVIPATTKVDEAGSNLCAFPMASNMHIEAEPGSVFRIANNVSTDSAPIRMSMFFSNQVLHDISFRNLTMDMNGANNTISPSRPTTYNVFTQAAIIFSGTPSGIAAGATDVRIDSCKFLNTAGVSCIVMAQSNTANVTLGKRWTITNCLFNNNGLDTNDHSSIFGWADDVLVEGCTFIADTMQGTVGQTGALVAHEIHGSSHRFVNNKVRNYYQGLWASVNLTSTVVDTIIAGNVIGPVKGVGVDFYFQNPTEQGISRVLIDDNAFYITDDTTVIALKAAVQISALRGVSNVSISNNKAYKTGTNVGSTFFNSASPTVAGNIHDNISISDNVADGFVFGANIATSSTNGYGRINLQNNNWSSLTPTSSFTTPVGITTSGSSQITYLGLNGNTCTDIRGTPLCKYGIFLGGSINVLSCANNYSIGMSVANYAESSLTVIKRQGRFSRVPYTPVVTSNAVGATIGNGSVSGYYDLNDNQVTASISFAVGSTTVFNSNGTLSFSLPLPMASIGGICMGQWRLFHGSVFRTGVASVDASAGTVNLAFDTGIYVTNTAPAALGGGDIVSVQITYQI